MAQYGRLYHRHDEWSRLIQAYDTRHKRHLVITVGEAGTGKTALIETCLREKVQEDRGFFVQGRFDHLDHPDPYSPWVDSAGQLISSLIAQCSTDDLGTVINSVEKNMEASELAALTTLIPILGNMMNKTTLSNSRKNRTAAGRLNFMLVFGSFLRGVTALKRPIVWFLDNVHNADASTLEIIKLLLAGDHTSDILPIIAFRPVDSEHPTSTFLVGLEQSEVELVPIIPSGIPESAVEEWIAASYSDFDLTNSQQLSKMSSTIAENCEGHVLAIKVSLEIINLNRDLVNETCGTPRQLGGDTRSLVKVLMEMLSDDCRIACMAASCIGEVVDFRVLTQLFTGCDLSQALKEAEHHGLLKFHFHDQQSQKEIHEVKTGYYVFANSTYRELVYNNLDAKQRAKYHKAIATALVEDMDSTPTFRVIVHMALAVDLLSDDEMESMVSHCVNAGRFAMQWSEFALASKILRLGLSLLLNCRPGFWKIEKSLITCLYCYTAEVDVLLGQGTEVETLLEEAKNVSHNPVDRLKIAKARMCALLANQKYPEAISVGTKALLKSTEFKKTTSLAAEVKSVRTLLESGENFASLSAMVDSEAVATMEVMDMVIACAMVHQVELVPILACRMVRMTHESGLVAASPFAISLLGALLCLQGVDVEMGFRLSTLGLSLVEGFVDKSNRGRVMAVHWGVSVRFFKPWMACLDPMKTAYRSCMRASDCEFGMMCPVLSIMNMFAAGIDDLRSISEATASVYNLLQRKNHEVLQRILRPYHQMILHLRGVSPETDPSVLTGAIMSEDEDIRYLKEHHNSTIEFSLGWCRALMLFHLHNFGEARVFLDRCQTILCQCPQVFLAPMQICLEYVSATTSSRLLWKYKRQQTRLSLAQTKRRAFLESSLQRSLTVLRSLARDCAENAQPQALMIQGEWQALNDQVIAAQDSFQQAIEDCDSSHALGIKAMFCEQAGLTLRVCSLDDTALNYLEDSCAAYRAWGAFFKVHQIKSNVIPEALNKWDE